MRAKDTMADPSLPLAGNQIILRDWQEPDVAAYVHWQHPDQPWHLWDGPYYPRPTIDDLARAAVRLRAQVDAGVWPTPRTRLVIATRDTDRLIGAATWYWECEATNWLQVGISIYDPANWGRGFGYEALGLWTDYLFRTRPEIVRVDLRKWSGNTGMMRLAEKVGFAEEARFRMARIVNGEYYDGMGYGVLRAEWEDRYPDGFAAHLLLGATSRVGMGDRPR
jgi:RimJ/RimL family protein N-acetyltransferase